MSAPSSPLQLFMASLFSNEGELPVICHDNARIPFASRDDHNNNNNYQNGVDYYSNHITFEGCSNGCDCEKEDYYFDLGRNIANNSCNYNEYKNHCTDKCNPVHDNDEHTVSTTSSSLSSGSFSGLSGYAQSPDSPENQPRSSRWSSGSVQKSPLAPRRHYSNNENKHI